MAATTKKGRKSGKTAAQKTTRKPAPKGSTTTKQTTGKKVANDRPGKALTLRRKGMTYQEIADALKYPAPQGARSAVVGALHRENDRDRKKTDKAAPASRCSSCTKPDWSSQANIPPGHPATAVSWRR